MGKLLKHRIHSIVSLFQKELKMTPPVPAFINGSLNIIKGYVWKWEGLIKPYDLVVMLDKKTQNFYWETPDIDVGQEASNYRLTLTPIQAETEIDEDAEYKAARAFNTKREKAVFYVRNLLTDTELDKLCEQYGLD